MADDVRVTNLPTPSSHEEAAFKLFDAIATPGKGEEEYLQLYARCLEATHRYGHYHKQVFGK